MRCAVRLLPLLLSVGFPACGGNIPPQKPPARIDAAAIPAAFAREQRDGVGANPRTIGFTIRLPDGARYRQGERIRVELAFTSSVPKTYVLDGGLYDRIGRLDIDTYHVAPDVGVVDPLRDWFEVRGGMGGIRTMPVLGPAPHRMTFDLNEWVRFDQPGRYWLFVSSDRVEHQSPPGARESTARDPTTSNLVEIDIVAADDAWAAHACDLASSALDGATKEDERREAARALRFLGSQCAASAMAGRFRGTDVDFDLQMGLVGSPHRHAAIAAMESHLEDAKFPVTPSFLETLALLRSKENDSRPDPAHVRRGAARSDYAGRLARALGAKTAEARAACVETLLEIAWQTPAGQALPVWFPAIEPEVGPSLPRLPLATQLSLLEYRWRRFGGPAMTETLEAFVADERADAELRRIAIHRLLEIDPVEGRKRVLEALRSGRPSLGVRAMETLGALPDASLPEIDEALATRLEGCVQKLCDDPSLTVLARVAGRYATSAIAPRLKGAAANLDAYLSPDARAALLTYFLRADPRSGEAIARRYVTAARSGTDKGAASVLATAASFQMSPALESALVEVLADDDAEVATIAAQALGKHGSSNAEKSLWARLERWHTVWAGRAEELRYRLVDRNPHEAEMRFESAIRVAISNGAGWLSDGAKLRRLATLLVSPPEKEQLKYAIDRWGAREVSLSVTREESGGVRATLAQYDFESLAATKAKMAQFPRGTLFAFAGNGDARSELEELRAVAEAHGSMIIR